MIPRTETLHVYLLEQDIGAAAAVAAAILVHEGVMSELRGLAKAIGDLGRGGSAAVEHDTQAVVSVPRHCAQALAVRPLRNGSGAVRQS